MMKYFLITSALFAMFGLGIMTGAMLMAQRVINTQSEIVYPTGYEVFEEVNVYRKSLGKEPLIMSERLCDNLSARWDNYVKNDSHVGLEDWAKEQYITYEISEVLTTGRTAAETVQNWKQSPGHNLSLLNNTYACTYSSKGASVMMLSKYEN